MRRFVFALMIACGVLSSGLGCDKMPWSKDDKKSDDKGDKKKKGKGEDKKGKKSGDDDDDDDDKKGGDKKKGDDDDDDKKGDDDDDDAASTGVKECDDYIKAYADCGKKMPKGTPKAAADAYNNSIKQQVDGFKQTAKADKATAKSSCKQILDSWKCPYDGT